jgi:hypothetical protein
MHAYLHKFAVPLVSLLTVAAIFIYIQSKKQKNTFSSNDALKKAQMLDDIKKIEKALYDGEG